MGKVSLITVAIGLLVVVLFGHFPKINDGEPLIDNDHDVLWSIIGYAMLILGLGAALFYYV